MATVKKFEEFYEIWMVDKSGNVTLPLDIPAKEFDEKKLSKRCCGYRLFKSLTKNGVAVGPKEYSEFRYPNIPGNEQERMKAYNSLKKNLL